MPTTMPTSEQVLGAVGLFAGLCVHTVVDGIALGAVLVGSARGASMAGIGVFLAILLHKPLDALSIETVMVARGWSSTSRWTAGTVFALLCPLTAAVFHFGASTLAPYDGLLPASLLRPVPSSVSRWVICCRRSSSTAMTGCDLRYSFYWAWESRLPWAGWSPRTD